ncbi:MAG TPA: hypothetical protein ENG36_02770 [Lentisphaerae bacterium]|nr:hypothetical protein [Lentisphaerota bacterium]
MNPTEKKESAADQGQRCELKCPHCGGEFEAFLVEVVDASRFPELKTRLLRNELNRVTCPQCDYMFLVESELLYRDPERRLMIYLMPGAGERWREAEKIVKSLLVNYLAEFGGSAEPLPEVQLVFSRTELIERIFILDKGYDLLAIEYIKYLIYTRNAGKVNPRSKQLLFNAEDSDERALWFVIQDIPTRRLEGVLKFEHKAYRAICETFREEPHTRMLRSLFSGPVINARLRVLSDEESDREDDARGPEGGPQSPESGSAGEGERSPG